MFRIKTVRSEMIDQPDLPIDTSCILAWLIEEGYEVYAFMADVGQEEVRVFTSLLWLRLTDKVVFLRISRQQKPRLSKLEPRSSSWRCVAQILYWTPRINWTRPTP
jgi:hypothetical protein